MMHCVVLSVSFKLSHKVNRSQAPVAHACNPSYSGGREESRFEASLGKIVPRDPILK
jgi:hypothetical protein